MATHAERLGQWRIDGKAEASVEGIAPNSEAEEQFIRQYIKEQKEEYKREQEEAKRQKEEEAIHRRDMEKREQEEAKRREEQKEEEAKREKEEAKQEAIRQRQLQEEEAIHRRDMEKRGEEEAQRQEEEAKREREEAKQEAKEEAKHRRDMEKREQDRSDREAEARASAIQDGRSGLSSPAGGMNSAPKAPRIPPPKTYNPQEERIDEFFHRFEHAATRHQWDEPTKLSHLQGALPPSELKRIDQMPQDRQNSYKDIKDFFLRIHAITTKKRREDFREHQPTKNDLPSWYAAELTRKFDLWIESAEIEKDYDSLRDFLILDQMRSNLPPHLLTVLEEKKAQNPTEAGEALDTYFKCRPQMTLARACQGSTDKSIRHKGSVHQPSTSSRNGKDEESPQRSIKNVHGKPTAEGPTRFSSKPKNHSTQRNEGGSDKTPYEQRVSERKDRGEGCPLHGGEKSSHTAAECRTRHGNNGSRPPAPPGSWRNSANKPSSSSSSSSSSLSSKFYLIY